MTQPFDPLPDPNRWVAATLVDAWMETGDARTLVLDAPELGPTTAGQHVAVRLTADDGYTAQRAYSLASAAGERPIAITVDRLDDGEVSPYLVDGLEVGHMVEVRGPIGAWFVWRSDDTRPVQLIAGGSGLVPLMSMIRTHAASGSTVPFRLLTSARGPETEFYRDELARLEGPLLTVDRHYSRRTPLESTRAPGRVTTADLARAAFPPAKRSAVFVCGPTAFVEAMADALLGLGYDADDIRAERFGPTG
jgi:ferredoxin-NADP reductase